MCSAVYSSRSLGGVFPELGQNRGMALLEGVGDVLQEDQAEHDVLVLGGVHRAPQGVGHRPQLGFVADRGPVRGHPRLACPLPRPPSRHVVISVARAGHRAAQSSPVIR